ncbi:MAG: hydroxyacid dehydrogenase [Hyphomicrobiales bacterium]|nr:MAG: hydroxyacid dehydrogenase [Hyphomicrobiales bacterium]
MSADILVMGKMLLRVMDNLRENFTVHRYEDIADKDAFFAEHGAAIRAIGTDALHGCSAALMDRLPNLEIVGSCGVGYDSIDVEEARKRGLRVTTTPDVLNDATAELAIALMMALARDVVRADQFVRAGGWLNGGYPLTGQIAGARAGIVGLGRIGKEIATRCAALKMEIAYHGRSEQPDQPYRYYGDLVEMARDVDWLVVIAPGTASTAKLISAEVIDALGPEGMLVNVARGTLVDEDALVAALKEGRLGGAALDVFADEPNVPEALFAMDNVVLSPHQGSATEKTRQAMAELVVENLVAHFAGKDLPTPLV